MNFEPFLGSKLYIDGMLVQAVKDSDLNEGCDNCVFKADSCSNVVCAGTMRHDKTYIHFEEVKGGEK